MTTATLNDVVTELTSFVGEKFNPLHDRLGRFTSAGGHAVSIDGGTPTQVSAIQETLGKLPESDVRLINSVRVAGSGDIARYAEGSIYLPATIRPSEIRAVMAHETGHAVWSKRLTPAQRADWTEGSKQVRVTMSRQKDPRMWYLKQVSQIRRDKPEHFAGEWFAECYFWHHESSTSRKFLESAFPIRARRIAEVTE